MDTISLENPMLSEDFSSETNDFVLRPASFVSFPTPSAIENIPFVAGFPKGILDNESRKRLEPRSGSVRFTPDYTFYSNKKLSIFSKKIFSKRTPEWRLNGMFPVVKDGEVGRKLSCRENDVGRSPESFEGFTDSETDDSTISSVYIDFIPEPTTFSGIIQDISSYP